MINWINSWRTGNKKNKIDFTLRLGFLTVFELKFCAFCEKDECCTDNFRLIILNFGFEI
jgi:hypothetical protein